MAVDTTRRTPLTPAAGRRASLLAEDRDRFDAPEALEPCAPWPEPSPLRTYTARLVNRLWLREVHGLEHLPREGTFVIAAPHASYLDFFVLAALFDTRLNRTLRFWAKTRMVSHPIFRPFCKAAGCLEVAERAFHGRLWRHSLECLLERDEPLCIFPEGTRSVSGEPGKFRLGYLKLAAEAGVPVVPVRIENTHAIWPPGRRVPRVGAVNLRIHEPVPVASGASGATLRQLNRRVRAACFGTRL